MITTVSLKALAKHTMIMLATLTVLFVLYKLGQVVLLFVLSIIVAAAIRKGVLWLEELHVPRSMAILAWYVVIIAVIGAGFYFLGPRLRAEIADAGNTVPLAYDALLTRWQTSGMDWQQAIANRLPTTSVLFQAASEADPTALGLGVLGLTSTLVNAVISLIAVLTLTFYWLADQERFERLWLALLPVHQRSIARTTWRDTETQVGAYVRSEAMQFVLTVGILAVAFQFLGLPYGVLLALYAGFAQLIPWIGIPLTLVPLAAFALDLPPETVLVAAGLIIATGLLMDRIVEARISKGAGGHPILTIVALLMLADSGGLLGMIVALPLAATFQIVIGAVIRANALVKNPSMPQEAAVVKEIRNRMTKIEADLPSDPDQRRALEGLLGRLDGLLTKAEQIVGDRSLAHERERERNRNRRIERPSIFQRRS